jgi:hypothetical protein
MRTFGIGKVLLAGLFVLAGTGQAAQPAASAIKLDSSAALQVRTDQQHRAAEARAAFMKANNETTVSTAGELVTNPSRAYPPSCLGNLVPFTLWQNDPNALQRQTNLYGDPLGGTTAESQYSEQVTVTVFRVPCAGGKSALLMEIDRPSGHDLNLYPIFPLVTVQSTAPCSAPGCPVFVPRVAPDPNTYFSDTFAFSPLYNSNVYIFENVFGNTGDFSGALDVTIDNLNQNDSHRYSVFQMPAYNPAQYPAASQPLPITGYMSGNWFDPNHGGEGIQIEVGEGTGSSRYIIVAWYAYDNLGVPYWLFGSGNFNDGDKNAVVTLAYFGGGGFAGNAGSGTATAWGNFNVSFTDCNTMYFIFASNPGLPNGVPTGSGTRIWTRLTQINGLTCQ